MARIASVTVATTFVSGARSKIVRSSTGPAAASYVSRPVASRQSGPSALPTSSDAAGKAPAAIASRTMVRAAANLSGMTRRIRVRHDERCCERREERDRGSDERVPRPGGCGRPPYRDQHDDPADHPDDHGARTDTRGQYADQKRPENGSCRE